MTDRTKARAMLDAAERAAAETRDAHDAARDDACAQRHRDMIDKFNRRANALPATAQGCWE